MQETQLQITLRPLKLKNWIPSTSSLLLLGLGVVFFGPFLVLFAEMEKEWVYELFRSSSFFRSLQVTLVSGAAGSLISVLLGTYFARGFALRNWRGKRYQRLILLIPYLVPNFILATAYVIAWNPATGALNSWLKLPFGLYGLAGMTLLFGVAHLPVAFLLLEEKIRRIDSSFREAARISGAKPLNIFFKIELPLLRPALASAFSLCFGLNISAFAIPAWIGAPEKVYPLTYKIYQTLQLGGGEGLPKAAVLSLILFLLALPPLLLGQWFKRNEKRYAVLSGKSPKQEETPPSPVQWTLFQVLFWSSQFVFWVAPLICLVLSTLVPPGSSFSSPWSLRTYHYVIFEMPESRLALQGSLIYGGLSALLIMVLSVSTLIFFSKSKNRLSWVEWFFSIPVATPGAIIALALIVSFSGRYGINLYNTPAILVLAFVMKHLSLAFQPLRTGLSNISGSLLEAGRLSGATPFQVWRMVILPILKPECLGAFFLVLIPILGELTMSIFLASPSFRSIGTVLFDLQDYADQASAGSLSVLLVLLVLMMNGLARWLSKGRLGY